MKGFFLSQLSIIYRKELPMSWLSSFFRDRRKSGNRSSLGRTVLDPKQLEDRLAPVVGAFFAVPAAITAPSQYDGVVKYTTDSGTVSSGSLIYTGTGQGFGHQILTVAHTIAKGPVADKSPGGDIVGSALAVRFDLARGGSPVPITISVPKNVDEGAQYQVQHSAYVNNQPSRNDIGLLLLTDQVTPAPDRLLVAPFGAQQYTLHPGAPAEVGQTFTMVGYGLTGTGATGSSMPDGVKRAGQNRFDATGALIDPAWTEQLVYDFDRLNDPGGQGNLDTLGLLYNTPDAGLGAAEAMHALGDSGAPAFVGANVIAGVVNRVAALNLVAPRPSGFGDVGYVISVSMTIGDTALQGILNPGGGARYDLVLDMNQQVYGRSNAAGGGADDLVIHARNVGGFLELHVNRNVNPDDPALNGLYYKAPAANIKSLTIRGTDDNETIRIEGDLVTVHGSEGWKTRRF